MYVRNALRWKGNQRRIQVVEIRVLISIIGSPMFGAWFCHFYRHLQWAKIWAAWLVLFQTRCNLLSSAIHITICATRIQFLIRTFESQGSGPVPVLGSNINFQGIWQNLFLGKLKMLQRPNCCSFCDIFGKPEGWTKFCRPPRPTNRASLWIRDGMTQCNAKNIDLFSLLMKCIVRSRQVAQGGQDKNALSTFIDKYHLPLGVPGCAPVMYAIGWIVLET